MRTLTLRRLSVAIGVAAALVGMHASPSAAAGWDITGGNIHVQKGLFLSADFDLANPEEDDCAEELPEASIDVTFDDPSSGDVDVDFSSMGRTGVFGLNYQATITGTTVSGTYTTHSPAPPDYDIDLYMDFVVQWVTRGAAPDCTPGQSVVCTWTISNVHFTGEYTGSIPPTTGDSVELNTAAAGTIVTSGCGNAALLNAFNGGSVTVSNLTADYV